MSKKKSTPKWIEDNIPGELANSGLFKFNVTFQNGKTIKIDLLADLDIDYEILEEHLETIPAQYMYWAAVYSELKFRIAFLDIKLAKRKRELSAKTIAKFRSDNVKLTDKQFLAIVDNDDKSEEIQLAIAVAHKNCGKVYNMVEAIRMKSEHCRSLAGFKRHDKEQSAHTT